MIFAPCVCRILKAIEETVQLADSWLEAEGMKLDEAMSLAFQMFEFGRDHVRYGFRNSKTLCVLSTSLKVIETS
jgi:hypothetical protein